MEVDPTKSNLLLQYINIEVLFLELLIEVAHRRITLNNRVDHIVCINDMEERMILFFTFPYDYFDSLFKVTSECREKETNMLARITECIKKVPPYLVILKELPIILRDVC